MKIKHTLLSLFLLLALCGCAGRLLTPVYAPVPPGSTNAPVIVGYVPNTNAVGIAGTVGAVGQAVPPPGNWIIGGLATLFVTGLGAYAKIKTNQATNGQAILNAVIAGVEAAGTASAPVKASIATHVAALGKGAEFNLQVQDVARKM